MSGNRHNLRTPLGQVRGLGAAGSGTSHFWHQRVTSMALISLTIVFVVTVMTLLGRNHAAVVQIIGSLPIAILMVLFVGTGIYHMWLGMQEIIVDYVHEEKLKLLAVMSNSFFCLVIGVACIFSILKLSFGV
jgi:succinate dehydrogenase / fumarate reductase membrane anchor subunit